MRKSFHRGLVVGKFSPLHRGHQSVIDRAVQDCEEVVILSYSKPEFPGYEAPRRQQWLDCLYPQTTRLVVTDEVLRNYGLNDKGLQEVPHNDAPEIDHRLFVARLCKYQLGFSVDAVFTSENYGDGFATEMTRFFQSFEATASKVHHISVDQARSRMPISGTAIRADIHAHRRWMDPRVYASFVETICFLGGESSGKTTLAETVARQVKTTFVPEYGRDLWIAKQGKLEFDDMVEIGRTQVSWEEKGRLNANRYLVCDTSPLTTLYYSNHLFGRLDPELAALAQRKYDLTVLCAPDFPFVQDGTRVDDGFRKAQDAWYRERLAEDSQPWIEACGTFEERLQMIKLHLENQLASLGDPHR